MVRKAAIILAFSVGSIPAVAGTPASIWKDIAVGDTPQVVAGKLAALPGVKSAKVKAAKAGKHGGGDAQVTVSYDGSVGIPVFNDRFAIVPEFDGSSLRRIGLGTDWTCTNDIKARYANLYSLLLEKYPRQPAGEGRRSDSEIARAALSSATSGSGEIANVFTNDAVAVFLRLEFTTEKPPAGYITTNRAANAIGNLAWNLYESRGAECAGTGHQRVRIMLVYMAAADFQATSDKIKSDFKRQAEAAKDNL